MNAQYFGHQYNVWVNTGSYVFAVAIELAVVWDESEFAKSVIVFILFTLWITLLLLCLSAWLMLLTAHTFDLPTIICCMTIIEREAIQNNTFRSDIFYVQCLIKSYTNYLIIEVLHLTVVTILYRYLQNSKSYLHVRNAMHHFPQISTILFRLQRLVREIWNISIPQCHTCFYIAYK